MPCFGNGQILGPAAAVPRKVVLIDQTLFGVPKTISIDWQATFDVKLEQLTMHWGGIPATNEDVVLWTDASAGSGFDVIFRNIDPAYELITDICILAPFMWIRNDHVVLDYPNTDSLAIGAKIILREVFE